MLAQQEVIKIQETLKQQVITTDYLPSQIKLIAGVDVEYDKDSDTITTAIVLLDYHTLEVIEIGTHCMQISFPYIWGYSPSGKCQYCWQPGKS